MSNDCLFVKFVFSKKATKIEGIFTIYSTLRNKCQIDGEDFVNFCGLLRKHELPMLHQCMKVKSHSNVTYVTIAVVQRVT